MPPAFIALGAKDRDDISIGMPQPYLNYEETKVLLNVISTRTLVIDLDFYFDPVRRMPQVTGPNGFGNGWVIVDCWSSPPSRDECEALYC